MSNVLINNGKNSSDQVKTEKEQTVFRLAGLLVWSCYLFLIQGTVGVDNLGEVVRVTTLYLLLAVCLSLFVDYSFFDATSRRYAGIILDITLTSVLMYFTGSYGAPLFCVYMWVIVGNGFRYGGKYMLLSVSLSLVAFIVLSNAHEFWASSKEFVFTGLLLLVVVPAYLFVLLGRLNSQRIIAEQASAEKSRFIANVSHELRTPLNAIVGFSDLIDKVDRSEQRRMAELMQESSESLVALVENVLDLSRIEAGYVDLQSEVLDLRRILDSVGGMFSLQTQEKGLNYCAVVEDGVPDYVAGDKQRIRQVLINLIGNAVKFTRQGRVDVRLGVVETETGGKFLKFEVSDTGPGIPSEMRNRIFERFTQVDDSGRRQHQGAGLGTAIAKSLVELMGGEIDVEPGSDTGACFWFRIPLRRPSAVQLREHLRLLLGEPEPGPKVDGLSVLVAEDCAINRRVYRKMFGWLGIEVAFAETGEQVFELLERGSYRLLIVDMRLPGMSGLDIVKRYNADYDPARRIPIAVITGDATADLAAAFQKVGVSAFIPKPVDLSQLQALTERFLAPDMAAQVPGPA